jgi:hypothetical protein
MCEPGGLLLSQSCLSPVWQYQRSEQTTGHRLDENCGVEFSDFDDMNYANLSLMA